MMPALRLPGEGLVSMRAPHISSDGLAHSGFEETRRKVKLDSGAVSSRCAFRHRRCGNCGMHLSTSQPPVETYFGPARNHPVTRTLHRYLQHTRSVLVYQARGTAVVKNLSNIQQGLGTTREAVCVRRGYRFAVYA